MRKLVEIALGVLTAIGGFVDIGDLVASTETGARFGLALAWVLLVGVVGVIIYAEMAGGWRRSPGAPSSTWSESDSGLEPAC